MKTLPHRPNVLGLDMGFAGLGWSVYALGAPVPRGTVADRVLDLGIITTKPTPKKRRAFTSDDNHRRTAEIYLQLRGIVDHNAIRAVAAETFIYHRGIKASAKMGLAWGALIALITERDLPLLEATPQEIKKVLCDDVKATKDDVQRAVLARYGSPLADALAPYADSLHEHAYDSVGAIVACLPSNTIKLLRTA